MIQHIYIHFPYCIHKCGYCDFNSHSVDWTGSAFLKKKATYLQALAKELALWSRWFREHPAPFSMLSGAGTIFMGGGTPSLFEPDEINFVLNAVREHFPEIFSSGTPEITMEANPESLIDGRWEQFSSTLVNRISFGIQSFRSNVLTTLERQHKPEHALELLAELSKQERFRWSGDFIYGVPGLSITEWQEDLERYISFRPRHISAYQLTLKPAHVLYPRLMQSDEAFSWFEMTRAFLRRHGLAPYETSNFATESNQLCQHNVAVWDNRYFLGIGAGAGGFIPSGQFGQTTKNVSSPEQYMQKVFQDGLPTSFDSSLTRAQALEQALMMGLRLYSGISLSKLRERFGKFLPSVQKNILSLEVNGFLTTSGDRLQLTWDGHAVADEILLKLIDSKGEVHDRTFEYSAAL